MKHLRAFVGWLASVWYCLFHGEDDLDALYPDRRATTPGESALHTMVVGGAMLPGSHAGL